MPLTTDLKLDGSKFGPRAVSQKTSAFNQKLMEIMAGGPAWYEVGAAKYREMRANGETPLPAQVLDPRGQKHFIPSRDAGRDIPTRVFEPIQGKPKAVFMHIHGGGWVLQSEESQDHFLRAIADNSQLTVVSIGYRLAPEDPFPAGPQDIEDSTVWLIDNALDKYGAEMAFVGGESAGGHLSALAVFHAIRARPDFYFRGVVFNFGAFDLSGFLPTVGHFDKPLILTGKIMEKYMEAFLPGKTPVDRRDPTISPFFENLPKLAAKSKDGKLPPALFTCGTEDPLLDDTLMFSVKWLTSGSDAVVKIYPGAPHGFILFSPELSEAAAESVHDLKTFLDEKLA